MHKCLIIRNLMGVYWEEGALLWGHLLLFCSDPAEAQKVINKVATEKGVLYKLTESKEKRGEEYLFERSECFTLWPWGSGCLFKEGSL